MKIMLIGGAGFIGNNIARQLLQNNHEVIIYDAFIQYTSPMNYNYNGAIQNRLKDLKDFVKIIRGDTRDISFLTEIIDSHKPEVIIQLAHLPLANISAQYTEEATTSIINGTVNILNIMKDRDFVKKIIYASSSMTYGDFKEIPAPENHPQEPKDVYGGMKLAGEKIIQAYSRRFGVNYVIIRPSAVYGFTDVNERVSGIFIKNAFEGKELILNNRGDTKLDFTYVEDTAKGFVLACDPEIKNEIFNITRGEGRSLKEFAEIVKKIIPSTKIKINGEEDSFRPKRGAMDISKARNILGYEPKYSLEEGIKKTINLIKENENSIM